MRRKGNETEVIGRMNNKKEDARYFIILIVVVVITIAVLVFCNVNTANAYSKPRFEFAYSWAYGDVYYDTDTGVMYNVSTESWSYGALTLLVNADGTPKIWKE